MVVLYYFRVFFVGLEFCTILLGVLSYIFLCDIAAGLVDFSSMNQEAMKWLVALPAVLTGWTFKEGRIFLFPEGGVKVLHDWPEYWALKVHFDVGMFNSVLYLAPCLVVWLFGWFGTILGLWVFTFSFMALGLNAWGFYLASIRLKEILLKV